MRIIALEEHFNVPELVQRIPGSTIASRGWPAMPSYVQKEKELAELNGERLAVMDRQGITMQILSVGGLGANLLEGADAVQFAFDSNERLASTIREHPDRFGGFAHLALAEPTAAADELERCVSEHGFYGAMITGTVQGKFLDDPSFRPVLARAEQLAVPLYIHPDLPPQAVRDAYYQNLPDETGILMGSAGWGWHYETAVHVLRLAVSGTLDRFPRLKVIVGHMGEGLPAMLARCDQVFSEANRRRGLRSVSEILRNQLWITTSGFHDLASYLAVREAFGVDRLLFSTDYPYNETHAMSFFDLVPMSADEKEGIASRNASALLGISKNP